MDQINKWLTPIANIAVVAGIIFLAVEVRQTNTLMRATAFQARSDDLMDQSALAINSAVLRSAMRNSRLDICTPHTFDFEALSEDEKSVLASFLRYQSFRLQNLHQQYLHGLLTKDYHRTAVLGTIQRYVSILKTAEVHQYRLLEDILVTYDGEFRSPLCE